VQKFVIKVPSVTEYCDGEKISMEAMRILNQKSLANLLGIDRVTLWRWHDQRIGPPRILIKKRHYYVLSSVQEWLQGLNDISIRRLKSTEEVSSSEMS
jgi:predicted DNA-binding transcriptional regulator AlpA